MHGFYECDGTRRISTETPGATIQVHSRCLVKATNLVDGPMGMGDDIEKQLRFWKRLAIRNGRRKKGKRTGEHDNVDIAQ